MKLLFLSICISLSFVYSSTSQTNALKSSMDRGEAIYSDFCVSCHLPTGEGIPKVYPPLAKSDFLIKNRIASIHIIKYGTSGEITVNGIKYNGIMAPLGLTDDEVADVMNYITNSWGNKNSKIVTKEEVSKIKK